MNAQAATRWTGCAGADQISLAIPRTSDLSAAPRSPSGRRATPMRHPPRARDLLSPRSSPRCAQGSARPTEERSPLVVDQVAVDLVGDDQPGRAGRPPRRGPAPSQGSRGCRWGCPGVTTTALSGGTGSPGVEPRRVASAAGSGTPHCPGGVGRRSTRVPSSDAWAASHPAWPGQGQGSADGMQHRVEEGLAPRAGDHPRFLRRQMSAAPVAGRRGTELRDPRRPGRRNLCCVCRPRRRDQAVVHGQAGLAEAQRQHRQSPAPAFSRSPR